MMLKWLKKKLRNWLLEDDGPVSTQIEILSNGIIERVTATRAAGLYLNCCRQDGSELMVDVNTARDASHFRKLWIQLSGNKMVWEDGTPYGPLT